MTPDEYDKLLSLEGKTLDEIRKLQKIHYLITSLKQIHKPPEYIKYSEDECQE